MVDDAQKNHAGISDYMTSCLKYLGLSDIFIEDLDDFTWLMTHTHTHIWRHGMHGRVVIEYCLIVFAVYFTTLPITEVTDKVMEDDELEKMWQ
jgi:hypothetical protein